MSKTHTDFLSLVLPGWLLPVAALVVAEIAMRATGVQSDGLALPSQIATALLDLVADGEIFLRSAETIAPIAIGILIGGTLGLLIGVCLGLSTYAARLAWLSIELFRPIPPVAVIPLTMLIYGIGIRMEAAIIGFACFWPMLLLTRDAVADVDVRLFEVARMLGLSRRMQIVKIALPAAAPRIFTALRLTLGIALIVAVTTEIAANPFGLGYALISAGLSLRPDVMYAFLAWLALARLAAQFRPDRVASSPVSRDLRRGIAMSNWLIRLGSVLVALVDLRAVAACDAGRDRSTHLPALASLHDGKSLAWPDPRRPACAHYHYYGTHVLRMDAGFAWEASFSARLIGLSRRARYWLTPTLELLRPLPATTLLPIGIALFGLQPRMLLGVIAFGAIWPVLLPTIHGFSAIEPRLHEVARNLGVSPSPLPSNSACRTPCLTWLRECACR